jgi:hypothetical protein
MVKLDSNLVDNLTEDQVSELRKKLNPYGRTVEGSGKYTCASVVNLSEQYMQKLLMTSLIGFLFRQCDEYELDDGEPPIHMDDFDKFMTEYNKAIGNALESRNWLEEVSIDENDMAEKAKRLEHTRTVERGEGFKRRLIVRQFLDGLFQFNPDKHVRSAYSDNPLDPERVEPKQIKRKNIKKIIGKSGNVIEVENKNTTDTESKLSDKDKERSESEFVKHIPPADVFHRWKYYLDSNYEECRQAVNDLYADKPDLEFAINVYDQFDHIDKTKKFVQKHKNEVIADIFTLTNSSWNLLGSFKDNRDRVNFYNEKTAVIEEIFKQHEQDKKLGADLMRKRVKRKKQKNIEESGPDPEEFKQYKKDNPSGFSSMGAEEVLTENNKSTTDEKVSFKNHEDCPYDAVQVDVFDFRKGGQTVKKSEFFTQAEAPDQTHPEEKS